MSEESLFRYLAKSPPTANSEDVHYANGIFADTGLPLCQMQLAELAQIASQQVVSKIEQQVANAKHRDATVEHLGTIGEVDPNNLAESGWAVVFPADADDARKRALQPLIEHRRKQIVDNCEPEYGDVLCRGFENHEGYRAGESCADWLARQGVGLHVVDPLEGVPFYLLAAGWLPARDSF